MTSFLLLLFVITTGIAAEDPKKDSVKEKDSVKKEKEKLQGIYGVSRNEFGGIPNPEKGVPVFEITPDKFTFSLLVKQDEKIIKKEGTEQQATYTLDPSKDPKHIDITFTTGRQKAKTLKGIYTLKGNELRLALGAPGKERPKEFSSKNDPSVEVLFLERAPTEKK